jgi:DNA-binding LacI/PurR family transcriptional regulator
MAVTITHVAEKAEVSKTTVSRVLSKTPGFKYSEATCKKVFAAAEALKYTPSSAAQLMRLKDIKMVGICTQPKNSMFSYSLLEKLSKAIKELGYYPILIDVNESFELLGSPHLHRMDYLRGIMCLYTAQVGSIKKLCNTYNKQIPIISLGANTEAGDNVKVVAADHGQGAELATKHLYDLGHKNIVHVYYDKESQKYLDDPTKHKLHIETVLIPSTKSNTYDYGNKIAEYLYKNRQFSAVLCQNDEIAMGTIHGLMQRGIKVPDDLSVIGYDNMPFSAYTNPGLTTVSQNVDKIVSISAKVLISSIEGSAIHHDFIPAHTKIPPELIIRESTKNLNK